MKKKIISKLKKIIDPHIGVNIYDMGLIKNLEINGDVVSISFKPTSPFCPMLSYFTNEIENQVTSVKGVKKVKIKIEK